MDRVMPYAKKISAKYYKGLPNYKLLSKVLSQKKLDELALKHNEKWIKSQMKKRAEIIDIGPDFRRRLVRGYNQPAYEMERRVTKDYSRYKQVFKRTGKYSGGVPGLDW